MMKKRKNSSKFILGGLIVGLLVIGGLAAALLVPGNNSSTNQKNNSSSSPSFFNKPTPPLNPTSGPQTYVRLDQYNSQPSNDSIGSIIVSVNLTVVPGQDLNNDQLIFSLLLNGSNTPLLPQLPTPLAPATPQPTQPPAAPPLPSLSPMATPTQAATFDPTRLVAQSFWLSFVSPASSNGGVFVVTLASNNLELFRQQVAWMNKTP
jgi:hypothetical protein